MQLGRTLLVGVIANLIGCSQTSDLQDSFGLSEYRRSFADKLHLENAAPLILFGRVLDVKEIGAPARSPGDARIKTQLVSLAIKVHEVIKGTLSSPTLDVFYFTYSKENPVDLGLPRYIPAPGQERVFFLKVEGGRYRSVGDVADYTLPVDTGSHPRGFCEGKTPGCCIADLLLVPGENLDVAAFAGDLVQSEYVARTLCSRSVSQRLVEKLTQHSDGRIANRARDLLANP